MKVEKLAFGKLIIFNCFMIGEMNEGEDTTLDTALKIIEVAQRHFKGQPWGYISNRTNSYSLDPCIHIRAPEYDKTWVAFAAVVHKKQTEEITQIEQAFHLPIIDFSIFYDLDEAKIWMESIVMNKRKVI